MVIKALAHEILNIKKPLSLSLSLSLVNPSVWRVALHPCDMSTGLLLRGTSQRSPPLAPPLAGRVWSWALPSAPARAHGIRQKGWGGQTQVHRN